MTIQNFHSHAKLIEESMDKCPQGLRGQTEEMVDEQKTLLLLRVVDELEQLIVANQQ
jgi:hypothetical protein